MLFWEALESVSVKAETNTQDGVKVARLGPRLPFDKRCAALTKSGRRCRARAREAQDFCPFHDPAVSPQRRRMNAAKGGRNRGRRAHLPDGYLRKLTDPAAVGSAMDRLYREVRLGIVNPAMGRAMLEILGRILDALLTDPEDPKRRKPLSPRAKVARLKPKLQELLAQVEQHEWREAVAKSKTGPFKQAVGQEPAVSQSSGQAPSATEDKPTQLPVKLVLSSAS